MKKQIAYDVTYWLIVAIIWAILAYAHGDRGAVMFWWRVHRGASWLAYKAGRINLTVEARYHSELEKTRL